MDDQRHAHAALVVPALGSAQRQVRGRKPAIESFGDD